MVATIRVQPTVKILFFISALLFAFSCSEGLNFAGDKKRDDSSDEGAELVGEPVMVGGAFLTCGYKNQGDHNKPDPDGTYKVGCRISSRANLRTMPLWKYETNWVVMDSERNEVKSMAVAQDNIAATPAQNESKYWHVVYAFPDKNFRSYNLEVSVISASRQDNVIYSKDLEKFDMHADRAAAQIRFGLMRTDYSLQINPNKKYTGSNVINVGEDQSTNDLMNDMWKGIAIVESTNSQRHQQSQFQGSNNYSNSRHYGGHNNAKPYKGQSSKSQTAPSKTVDEGGDVVQTGSGTPPASEPSTGTEPPTTAPDTNTAGESSGSSGSESGDGGSPGSLALQSQQWEKIGGNDVLDAFLDYAVKNQSPSDCKNPSNTINQHRTFAESNPLTFRPVFVNATPTPWRVGNADSCIFDRYLLSLDKSCIGILSIMQAKGAKAKYFIHFQELRKVRYGSRPNLSEFLKTKEAYSCL